MRARRCFLVLVSAAVLVVLVAAAAGAAAVLEMHVEVGGQPARDRANAPAVELDPHDETVLRIEVTNAGDEPVTVRHVVFAGEAVSFQFVTYDINVARRVPAGETRVIRLHLDLYDLSRQATGYLAAAVRLYDGDRKLLAEQKFIVDVEGSWSSILGVFAVALLVISVVCLVLLGIRVYRRELSRNRAVRGFQFMLAGAAIGLLFAIGLPVLRWSALTSDAWIPLVVGPMAIGFVLGYLAPGPISYSVADAREDEMLDIVATQALERISAEHTAAQAAAAAAEAARHSGETIVSGTTEPRRSGETIVSGTTEPRRSGETIVSGTTEPRRSGETVVSRSQGNQAAPATTAVPRPDPTAPGDTEDTDERRAEDDQG